MSDPKAIWQTQVVEENNMVTLADIRARARRFQFGVRWRNIGLYAYSVFSIPVPIWIVATGRFPNIRYPMLLMVAAHLLVLWLINHRISGRPLPADMAVQPALDFHRQQLERQAHGLSRAWLWYMMPFVVPFVWELAIWLHRIQIHALPPRAFQAWMHVVVLGVVFWTAVLLAFSRAQVRVQLQIERLKALKAE